MFDEMEIVKEGTWIYDDTLILKVQILKSPILYGSGDYEDPPEIQNDKDIECYYVQYESTTEKNRFNAGGRGFYTLEEAIMETEIKTNNTVTWK